MKPQQHTRHHWIAVAAVAALGLLTLSEASGQSTGAQAVFEGRPAMAGAQAGTGAMAGPPQGGVGVQGSQASGLQLQRPANVSTPSADERALPRDDRVAPRDPGMQPGREREDAARGGSGGVLTPQRDRDPGLDTPRRAGSDQLRRAGKRTRDGARHGVTPLDMQ